MESQMDKVYVKKLSREFCCKYGKKLLSLINTIPHITWSMDDLLSQSEDFYGNKWNYSYVIMNGQCEIIGVIIAYFRISDKKHIFDSLYLHKFVIEPNFQKKGIGTFALHYFVKKSFQDIPWLLNISVQTNDSPSNKYVIKFYHNIGFQDMYHIVYSNKTDILMLLERKMYAAFLSTRNELGLRHPRLNPIKNKEDSNNDFPIIYFSSENEKKRGIVEFIFHNYNIEVSFVKSPIELVEPQIERANLEDERKLVSMPLKSISRFIKAVPYTIEDTMLFIEFFNRGSGQWELPGLDTKRWLRQLGIDGILDILGNSKKRKAKFVSQTGAYIEANNYFYGRGELSGTIAYHRPEVINQGYGTYPYFFHQIFIPEGENKTIAEMNMYEYAKYDYMRKSILQLISGLSVESHRRQFTQYTLYDYFCGE